MLGWSGRLLIWSSEADCLPPSVIHKRCRCFFGSIARQLAQKIEAEIDALADDANALTAEQRTEQVGEIDRDDLPSNVRRNMGQQSD